jgi:uncharacterized Fe-S radical SAM superfamily protein PflX
MLLCRSVCWSICWSICQLVRWLVCPHITLSAFFSAICRWIDLKFGRHLHVDLLFQFLFCFFLSSSSNYTLSSSSSEIEVFRN